MQGEFDWLHELRLRFARWSRALSEACGTRRSRERMLRASPARHEPARAAVRPPAGHLSP